MCGEMWRCRDVINDGAESEHTSGTPFDFRTIVDRSSDDCVKIGEVRPDVFVIPFPLLLISYDDVVASRKSLERFK
jgi:hypothetical protein